MTWLSAIMAAMSAISAVVEYLRGKQAIDAASARILSAHLKGAIDEIREANKMREGIRADVAANPDRVRQQSDFSRD